MPGSTSPTGPVQRCLRAAAATWVFASVASCGGLPGGTQGEKKQDDSAKGDHRGVAVSWSGWAGKEYAGDENQVMEAIRVALDALSLELAEESEGTFGHYVEATSLEGTEIAIKVEEVEIDRTSVEIKVGYWLGDKKKARRIHSEIEKALDGRARTPSGTIPGWGVVEPP